MKYAFVDTVMLGVMALLLLATSPVLVPALLLFYGVGYLVQRFIPARWLNL